MAHVEISPERLQAIHDTCDARNDSLDALEELCASAVVPLSLKRRFEHLFKVDHRIQIYRFTLEAGELWLRARPTKMYLKKVAAVPARYFDQCPVVVTFRHGWPILSLVSRNSNVTEAGGVSNLSGGGAA